MKLKLFVFISCLVVIGAGISHLIPAEAEIVITSNENVEASPTEPIKNVEPTINDKNVIITTNKPENSPEPTVSAVLQPQGNSNQEIKPTINPCSQ